MLESVKVGGINYQVELVDLTTQRDEEIGWQLGYCHFHKDLIEINSKISEQRQRQTLVHEMMHAIYEEAGVEQDEGNVDALAKVVYQVVKDNDVGWLNKPKYQTIETKDGAIQVPITEAWDK